MCRVRLDRASEDLAARQILLAVVVDEGAPGDREGQVGLRPTRRTSRLRERLRSCRLGRAPRHAATGSGCSAGRRRR